MTASKLFVDCDLGFHFSFREHGTLFRCGFLNSTMACFGTDLGSQLLSQFINHSTFETSLHASGKRKTPRTRGLGPATVPPAPGSRTRTTLPGERLAGTMISQYLLQYFFPWIGAAFLARLSWTMLGFLDPCRKIAADQSGFALTLSEAHYHETAATRDSS